MSQSPYFLVVYDPESLDPPQVSCFGGGDRSAAASAWKEAMIEYRFRPEVETVLFQSQSLEKLKAANARYFHREREQGRPLSTREDLLKCAEQLEVKVLSRSAAGSV